MQRVGLVYSHTHYEAVSGGCIDFASRGVLPVDLMELDTDRPTTYSLDNVEALGMGGTLILKVTHVDIVVNEC